MSANTITSPERRSYDLAIIGGGPAGLSAAIYAARAGLKLVILEAALPGGKVGLTSTVENWPGQKSIGGADLAMAFYDHASADEHCTYINTRVTGLRDLGAWKELQSDDGVLRAKAVLIASGSVERKLGIPGEAEFYGQGVSYCAVCDGAFFRDRKVVVIGGGNTAFEDADYLTRFAAHVTVVTRRSVSRADRVNQEKLMQNPKIEWIKGYKPTEILGNPLEGVRGIRIVPSEGGDVRELPCDAVFPLVGLIPKTDFLGSMPEILNKEGFIVTDESMRTAKAGVYAAGDVRAKGLRQIVTAAADGAIAAQRIAADLDAWSEGAGIPS